MKLKNRFIDEGWTRETPSGLINGVNTVYTLSQTPDDATGVQVFLNGILQRPVTDYTLSSVTITFITPPALGQDLTAAYTKRT